MSHVSKGEKPYFQKALRQTLENRPFHTWHPVIENSMSCLELCHKAIQISLNNLFGYRERTEALIFVELAGYYCV